jgi:pimeloyl-ACP methyl ester carboxylesterase
MRRLLALSAAALALGAASASAQAFKDLKPSAPLTLQSQGSFYVGGRVIQTPARSGVKPTDDRYGDYPGGSWTVDQMYVSYQAPPNAGRHVPVVMIHGCCLTAKSWETTPDGRMGWNEYFVRKGRATYMAEQVGRGRSGFDATPYNLVRQGKARPESQPSINMATAELAWDLFRFGPSYGKPFADEQFPVEYLPEMAKQVIPDLIAGVATPNPTFADLAALSNQLGGAVLIGHSQSGPHPQQAAQVDAKNIRGIVSIEPGNCATAAYKDADYATFAKIPTLVLYGDHIKDAKLPNWAASVADCRIYVDKVKALGGDITLMFLPDAGIHGNSHMLMQDRNNLQVADLVLKWIDDHVERRR